jgi:putative hydrolase of HD superfamily
MQTPSPAAIVQAQLDAYNAKNVDAFLQTYAPDAEQYTLHGTCLAKGREEIRSRLKIRFTEPNLYARLLSRVVIANVVVDAELITRTFPEGRGTIEMLCIYEIHNGFIQKASFSLGEQVTIEANAAT